MALDDGIFVCDGPLSNSKSADAATTTRRIPVEADLFIAYSVQPGIFQVYTDLCYFLLVNISDVVQWN